MNDSTLDTSLDTSLADMETSKDNIENVTEPSPQDNHRLESVSKDAILNKFGFYAKHTPPPLSRKQSLKLRQQDTLRVKKWIKMMNNWEDVVANKFEKLKRRVRKGIPDSIRAKAWCKLAHVEELRSKHKDITNLQNIRNVSHQCLEDISKDVDRTFPKHELFLVKDSIGQQDLETNLQLYAAFDPEVGYCQGMAFIAATFLTYLPQEDAFFCFFYVLQRESRPLRKMYLPRMVESNKVLYVFGELMRMFLPDLADHFQQENIIIHMFCTSWFMTLFTNSFSFDLVTRIFDIFLLEGFKIIYRVALALLKCVKSELLARQFEGILMFFKELSSRISDVDDFMEIVWSIPLKTEHIVDLEIAYETGQRATHS